MRDLKFRMITQTTEKFLGYVDIYDLLRNGSDVLPDLEEAILEGVAFEQYTGLKDKNGKEIYVGDIVSEHNGDIIGEIIQKPSGEYCIAWIGVYSGSSVLYDELSMCEVIGNVHESNMEELCPKE